MISKILSLVMVFGFFSCINKTESNNETEGMSFYDLKIQSLDGKSVIRFSDFKDKKVLLVNVASECGYTPQYDDLEKLSKEYKDKLVVIGFPCNQFGGQEPGNAEEIQTFCKKNYGVTFLLSEKIDVKGDKKHPVYQWLTEKKFNGSSDSEVKWNFQKYLVDEKGNLKEYFPSKVKPLDPAIIAAIKQ